MTGLFCQKVLVNISITVPSDGLGGLSAVVLEADTGISSSVPNIESRCKQPKLAHPLVLGQDLLLVVDDDVIHIQSLGVLSLESRGPRFSIFRDH